MTSFQCALLSLFFSAMPLFSNAQTADIYATPTGWGAKNGTRTAPVAGLEAAVSAALDLKKSAPNTKVHIWLEAGDYHLAKPVIIGPELNGLAISSLGSGPVQIKGSAILTLQWKPHTEHIFVAKCNPEVDFDQLVCNGAMQVLARYPDYNEQGGHWQGHAADAWSPERLRGIKHPEGAIFHAMHAYEWGDFHYVAKGIDADGNPILEGGWQNNRPAPNHKTYRMVENALELLDHPGEWFFDREKKQLYFWPEAGIDLKNAVFEGVILKNLLTIRGDAARPVTDISVADLTFTHARRTILEPYVPLLRSDWTIYRGGALFIEGAENCQIENCTFTGLGGNAIFVSGYARKVDISGNHIAEIGASGICFVGRPEAVRSPAFQYSQFVPFAELDTLVGPKSPAYPRDCAARSNLIHRTGRLEKQTAGIEIAMAMDITASHNSIYDTPRAGINIGDGTWGGHVLEYNDVFNTVLESGDHGSFNSWGRDRYWHPNRERLDSTVRTRTDWVYWDAMHTTVIRNNRFRCDHGWDIDLDDGSSNYHIYNNLCLNGGLKLREGFFRVVENNIILNNGFHPHVWFANCGDVFRQNIVMARHADIMLNSWGREVDYNFFTDTAALEYRRKLKGVDVHSDSGSPLFANPATSNYRVGAQSKALLLGFKPFETQGYGVEREELKRLAKQPDLPILKLEASTLSGVTSMWQGYTLKNLETLGEQSAAGVGSLEGVLVLHVPLEKAILQKGDVILSVNSQPIANTAQFAEQLKNASKTAVFSVMRQQKMIDLTVLVP